MMKKIHNIPVSLLCMLLSGMQSTAQTRQDEKQDNLQQQKVNFFTENLQLTPAESARFWPVYNDYQNRTGQNYQGQKHLAEVL